jgi:hypothetical protein
VGVGVGVLHAVTASELLEDPVGVIEHVGVEVGALLAIIIIEADVDNDRVGDVDAEGVSLIVAVDEGVGLRLGMLGTTTRTRVASVM